MRCAAVHVTLASSLVFVLISFEMNACMDGVCKPEE